MQYVIIFNTSLGTSASSSTTVISTTTTKTLQVPRSTVANRDDINVSQAC
jgi:hypothetical protein